VFVQAVAEGRGRSGILGNSHVIASASVLEGCRRPWYLVGKPRQHLCYVYASLSRPDFGGLPEKFIIVFEGVIGFSTAKKPTALMMHWWNGGRGGV
jgi:hypothetical protein